jgi:hypothetical protein
MKKITIVHLTGGLGNQLFQFAAALEKRDFEEVIFEDKFGKPRTNLAGIPDLYEFDLGNRVFETTKVQLLPRNLMSLVSNFMLRLGAVPTKFEKSKIFQLVLKITSSLILSANYSRLLYISVGEGLGFFHQRSPKHLSRYQVGYFQSYKWASDPVVFQALMALQPKQLSRTALKVLNQVKSNPPIIVHIRLGDYKNEDGFGIPSKKYYERAIRHLRQIAIDAPIWYFSDEPELARKYLGARCPDGFWFEDDLRSSCQLLEIMRHGSGYVIGNSTFSWWAAFLRKNQSAPVVSPVPWFRNNSPVDLIPQNWLQIDSGFDAEDKVWG